MRIFPVFFLLTVISISGCAAANQQARPSYKVVAASAMTQPEWLNAKSSEEAGYLFFVGQADGVRDLSNGEDQAEAQAKAVIRGALREQLRHEFEAGLGQSAAAQHEALEQALANGVKNLDLEGVTPVERYWERLEVPVSDGTVYAYRLALLVRMSKDRYEATRVQAHRSVASQIAK